MEPASIVTRVIQCALFACIALGFAGCTSPTDCSLDSRASIQVDVVDATTADPAAAGATVILQSSTFRDSVAAPATPASALTAYVWFEHRAGPGIYSVLVSKSGYQDWTQSNIHIVFDGCHVATLTRITAMLRR